MRHNRPRPSSAALDAHLDDVRRGRHERRVQLADLGLLLREPRVGRVVAQPLRARRALKERSEMTVRLQKCASECTLAPHESAPALASGM